MGETSKASPKKTELVPAKKDKGKKTIEKAKNLVKHGIEAMTAQQDGAENIKQRRGSFGHIINYANKLYD